MCRKKHLSSSEFKRRKIIVKMRMGYQDTHGHKWTKVDTNGHKGEINDSSDTNKGTNVPGNM